MLLKTVTAGQNFDTIFRFIYFKNKAFGIRFKYFIAIIFAGFYSITSHSQPIPASATANNYCEKIYDKSNYKKPYNLFNNLMDIPAQFFENSQKKIRSDLQISEDFQKIIQMIDSAKSSKKITKSDIFEIKLQLEKANAIDVFIKNLQFLSTKQAISMFFNLRFYGLKMNKSDFFHFQQYIIYNIRELKQFNIIDISQLLAEIDQLSTFIGKQNNTSSSFINAKLFKLLFDLWSDQLTLVSDNFPNKPSSKLIDNLILSLNAVRKYDYRLFYINSIRLSIYKIMNSVLDNAKDNYFLSFTQVLLSSGFLLKAQSFEKYFDRLAEIINKHSQTMDHPNSQNLVIESIEILLQSYKIALFDKQFAQSKKFINKIRDIAWNFIDSNPRIVSPVIHLAVFLYYTKPSYLTRDWNRFQAVFYRPENQSIVNRYNILKNINAYYKFVLKKEFAPLYPDTVQFNQNDLKVTISSQQKEARQHISKLLKSQNPSLTEADIEKILLSEFHIPETSMSVDFYVPNEKLVIEYNGTDHYLRTYTGHELTNLKTLRRKELLIGMGYTVIFIKYSDMNKLSSESESVSESESESILEPE